MSDEARHVAFGVLSLKEVYDGMTDAEMKDRQEFAYEAAVRMRDPTRDHYQQMLFSKIVPNCKKLGLLDRNESWLRRRFEEMGVIQFEDWENTGDEYLKFEIGTEAPMPLAGS